MDLRKLKKLIDLVEESGIAELEVTEGEEKVRITRVQAGAAMAYPAMTQVALPQAANQPADVLVLLVPDAFEPGSDALSTLVVNQTQVKIYAWYDNEWGYSNRMVDLAVHMARVDGRF